MTMSYVCPIVTSIGPTRSSPRSTAAGMLRNSTLCGKPPINDGLVPFEASLGHHAREPHRARLPVDGAVQLGDERAPARTCSGDPPACLDLPDRVGGLHQAAEGLERDDQGAVHGAAHLAGPEIAVVVGLADALELPDEGEGDSVRTGSTG